LSDKVDYYTTKFTNLETLISEMNSQSSMLSGLTSSY
jgi:flagellar hook-associated protein 2